MNKTAEQQILEFRNALIDLFKLIAEELGIKYATEKLNNLLTKQNE